MQKHTRYALAGIFLGLSFISFSFASGGITGFLIGGVASVSFWSFLGIILLVTAVIFAQQNVESLRVVIISRQAKERMWRDKRVRENSGRYSKQILLIRENPNAIQREMIGRFYVSPRGHNDIRIAWYYNRFQDTVIIYDLLYHIGGGEYTDNWISKVKRGIITPASYDGFTHFRPEDFSR